MSIATIYEAPETDPDEAEEIEEPTEPYDKATVAAVDPDTLAQIINANRKFKEQESIVEELKASLKAAKEEMDGSARLISRLISALENDEDRPLFAKLDAKEPDCLWKMNTIDELDDLPQGIRTCLRQADVATLGELADLIAKVKNGADMPKGLGPKKWDQVLQSLNTWHDNNGAVDSADVPASLNWSALSVEMQGQYLEGRAARLRPKSQDELVQLFPTMMGASLFAKGVEAQESGEFIVNCPGEPTDDGDWSGVDAWIAGFVWAEKESQ